MHSNRGTPTTGISKETFHSGFNVFDIVGVDCLESPNVTTKYCWRELSAIVGLVGSRGLRGRVSAYRITCATSIFRGKVSTLPTTSSVSDIQARWRVVDLEEVGGRLTLITVTLISSGFGSTDRIGLVLLLCPGVELALLAVKCELSRVGNGKRTMTEGWGMGRRIEEQW